MPPRQSKKKPVDEDDDDIVDLEDSDASLEEEEDESPKAGAKKKGAAAKGAAAKGKGKAAAGAAAAAGGGAAAGKKRKSGAASSGIEIEVEIVPKEKKPRAPAAKKLTGPTVDEHGWTCVPPSLIFRDFNTTPSTKIAGFDLDGTLITTKSGAEFPRNADDWRFISKAIPTTLQRLHKEGYKIVVFSNQGAIKSALTGKGAENSKIKLANVLEQAGIPAVVLFATGSDQYRKPSPGMWEYMEQHLNGGVAPDKSQSFYVGDAAGRPNDFFDKQAGGPSSVDKDFAAAIGVPFKVPEDIFPQPPTSKAKTDLVAIFKEMGQHFTTTGGDHDHFRAAALRKVAEALSAFEGDISLGNIKNVAALKGVGKNSVSIIKEYLENGKVAELEAIRSAKGGGGGAAGGAAGKPTAPQTEAAKMAAQFM